MTARPARSWTAPTRALYVSVASVVLAALMVVLPTSPALAANIDTVANTAFVNELGCTDASLTRITSMGGTGSTLPADTNAAGLVNGNATQNGPVSTIGQTFTLGDGGDGYPDTDEATLTVVHGDQVTKGNNQEWTGITGIPQSGTATSPPVVNRRTWTGAASGDGVNRLTGAWLQFGRAASYDDSQTVPGGVDTRGFKTLKITLPHAAKLQFNITGIDDDTGVRVQMSNGGTVVQHTAKAYAGSTFQELTQAAAGNSWISTIRGVTDQYWRENVDNRQTASYTSAGAVDTIIIGGSFQGSAGAPASNVAISDIWGCQALDAVKAGSVSGTPVAQDAFGTTYRTTTTVKVGNTGAAGALRVYGPQVSDNLANAFGSGSGAPTGTISNVSVTGVASDTSSPSNVAACTANAGYTGTGTNTLLTGSSTDYLDAGQSCTITISADVRFANPHGAIAKTNQAATTSTGGNATKESSTNGNALPATDKGDTASTTPYAFPSVLAPAAPVISTPVNGSTVTASSQVVSGTGIAGNTVTVKEGGTTICTTTVTVAGTWTCPASLFPNGAHTISATQTNPIGLESGASTSTFTVNAPLPVAPVIMTPAEGSTTNDAKPAITGTGTPGDTVTVKEGATTVCTATVQPDGSWSCAPTTPLSDGGHTVTATQKDPAGNTGPSDSQSFTVDATAPAAPLITGPAEGSVVNTTKPTITGTGEAGATVKVTDGSGATVCTALVQAGGTWSCIPSSPLPDGPQTLTATQIDPAGNTSAPVNVTFTVDTTAPDAPVIEGPVEGAVVNTATPSITGTGEDGATVTVTDAGGNVVCSTKVKGDGTWSCDPTAGLPEGQQTLTATQTDPSGNTSVPDQVTFTVDSGAPSPPVIEGPAEGAVVNTTKPTISGTGEADAKVTVTDAGGNVVCSATVQLDGTWSCDATTALPAGEQTLTATQTDPSGHTSAPDTVTFTVDTTVPAAPQITGPAEGAVVNTTKPTITGTGEADAKVTVTDAGGNIVCTATVQGDGTWACAPTTALPQGPQTVTATQTDPAGNVSEPSGEVTFTIDTTVPDAPVIEGPAEGAVVNTTTPRITGTGEADAKVTVTDAGGNVVCSATVQPDGTWWCDAAALPQGPQTVTATQTDPAGNTGPSDSQSFTVDTSVPGPPVIEGPAEGAVVNTTTPTISGTGEADAKVTVTDAGGKVVCSATVQLDGTWSCDATTALPQGPQTVTATQVDPAGNVSGPSKEVTFTVDTTAPAAPQITGPAEGAVVNTTKPTITGTGEADAKVTVTDAGGNIVCTATVQGDGTWACAPTTALPQGPQTVTATQTDPAGNVSGPSGEVTFTIDTTVPDAPVIEGPAEGAVVNTTTPRITGTGEADAKVTVTDAGGNVVCSATVQPDGTWWCAPTTALPQGPQTVTATQTDPAGNTGPSDSQSFTVDTSVPGPPVIEGPAEGAVVNTTTPTITGTGEADAKVTVTDAGGNVVCSATVQLDGTWSCDATTALPAGEQTLTATQVDPAGNTSLPDQVTFTVDTDAPAAPVIEGPAEGAVVNTTTPTISGTGEAGAKVTVTDAGGNVVCSATVQLDGTWSCDATTALPAGEQTLTATQTDPAGNTSLPDQVTFTVDTTAPAAPVIKGPAEGAVVNTTTPTITGTGEAGAKVTVTDAGGNVVCSATVQLDGTWSCDATTALPQGPQTVTATQVDPAGNVSGPSKEVTFTIDTTAPDAPVIEGPAEGAVVNTTTPTISGTGEADAKVTVTDAGGKVVCSATVQLDGTWSCDATTALPAGEQTLTATQTDPAGNTSLPDQVTFTVDTDAPDAPVIEGPAEGAVVNTTTPTISGSGEAGAKVTVTDAGGNVVCSATVQLDGTWSCDATTALPAGEQTLTATQTDPAGNTSLPDQVTFTVDTTAPAAPVIKGPAEGAVVNTTTPTITGTGEAGAKVTVTDAGGNVVCSATVQLDGTWSCDATTALPQGPQTVTATQVDPAGNVSGASKEVTFTIDTTAPDAPVIEGPAEGAVVNTTKPTITGTGEAGAVVTVVDENGGTVCTATVQQGGSWSCTPSTPLPEGEHTLTATQVDPAGNVSGPSGEITFTVDMTAPEPPVITGPVNGSELHDNSPVVTGTGEPGATVTVVDLHGNTICTAEVEKDGTWSCTPTTPLSEGEHTFTATQTDPAGNKSDPSAEVTFTVATEAGLALRLSGTYDDANGDGDADRGEKITWHGTLTNTGTLRVARLAVTDSDTSAMTCAATALEPGQVTKCVSTALHTITSADAQAGLVTDRAQVKGVVSGGSSASRGLRAGATVGDVVTSNADTASVAVTEHLVAPPADDTQGNGTGNGNGNGDGQGPGGFLPSTGAAFSRAMLAAAVALLGLGSWFIIAGARRRRDEEEQA